MEPRVVSSLTEDALPGAAGRDESLPAIVAGIQDHLSSHWPRYYPERDRTGGPAISLLRAPDQWGYSVTIRYAVRFPGDPRPQIVFAKLRRGSLLGDYEAHDANVRARTLARTEYEQLARAFRYFENHADGLSVVRPLDYLPDYNAVLIEKARGEDLGVILRARKPGSSAAVRRCGSWLKEFHDGVQRPAWHDWDPEKYQVQVAARRRLLEAAGVRPQLLDRACGPFLERSRALQSIRVPRAILHGDYKARHIWASDDGIQVFDFGNVNEDDCYMDAAAFVVELSVMTLWRPWMDGHHIDDWTNIFLTAYFAGAPPPVFPLYVADALLKKWHRRRASWSWGVRPVRLLHRALGAVGATQVLDRRYLDRWFAARLEHWSPAPA